MSVKKAISSRGHRFFRKEKNGHVQLGKLQNLGTSYCTIHKHLRVDQEQSSYRENEVL